MSNAPSPGTPEVPVCPRHPERVSYVRCQRCGRPVCPECQQPAAVGVHCVDCVREAARSAPTARTAFGAPVRGGAPVVTFALIGLNVLSYLLQLALGNAYSAELVLVPGFVSERLFTLLSSAFLHASIPHIALNMYALWILGTALEPALGRARLLTAYLVSALGGGVMAVLLADPTTVDWLTPMVGASGAVFGLFGVIFVVLRRLGRSARGIVAILVINGVLGFVLPNVSWQAHLGGFLTGVLLGLAYAYVPRRLRGVAAVAAPAALVVLLMVLLTLKLAAV